MNPKMGAGDHILLHSQASIRTPSAFKGHVASKLPSSTTKASRKTGPEPGHGGSPCRCTVGHPDPGLLGSEWVPGALEPRQGQLVGPIRGHYRA